ncbi:hypothetical protein [Hymenobacter sp. DG01]|uniref:hypothetical protein n=1 Tax=Hymenobacter sp. DG01 TaxID=2584940 RepID=UPI001123E889|nr:hypothetical protein [Hymenobacter sp. DG01]
MKKILSLSAGLVLLGSAPAFCQSADKPTSSMMIISNLSFGFDAQASIVTIAPDGTQQEKEVAFSRGSAKHLAANTTAVYKVALATINEYTSKGWRVVSTAPNGVAATGNTIFIQTIYVLEK